jgi:organic radical activating enzyme/predicted phosphodiesterase
MRVGICGGPYANPYALAAFIDDARRRGCERLYCLGDLGGFGAEVDALWPLLAQAGVTCVAGNYDVAIAKGDPDCGCGYRDPRDNEYAQLIYDYTRAHTSRAFARWMGRLPTQRRERLEECEVHFVHGSPLALNDFWWGSLPDPEHHLRVAASGADVICCTHTGLPWQRRLGGTLVVNVGVLGKPANDGRREVWYAILDIRGGDASAELVPLAYDWAAQASSMRRAGLPEPFVGTIETGWWATCIEVLPPAERSRGRFHLYRSSLPERFSAVGATWAAHDEDLGDDSCPVVPLFGSAYFPPRLWVYTNFHCNLACDYCAVSSSPRAEPRTISPSRFRQLVDEAVEEGFRELYLTGGEPLLHPAITELLAYATSRLTTVLLTNAMLFRGTRFERFRELAGNPRLVVQTSLDSARASIHDAHRGRGSFERTLEGISRVQELELGLRVAMTQTQDNAGEVDATRALLAELGVQPENFVVRPLLRRGFSEAGLEIGAGSTVPELTMTVDGAYWHPAGVDGGRAEGSEVDMLLAKGEVPLARAKQIVTERFLAARLADASLPRPYRCAV